ncbi:MAG: ATP-binding protein, partial [Acetatifactor sp.]|nr:ATP-binding protein [Acetatifactor sp.]
MRINQWIQDVQRVIGCEAPELLCVLAKIAKEDNSRGLFARKCQSKILECMEDVKLFLGEIRRSAQDFTLHDITHCINVIDFMGQSLTDINVLNPAEISFFIYSALLHDIGMVKLPDEDTSLENIREDHGNRSARFIRERVLVNNDGTPFSFGEYDYIYMEYLPSICASHMQEFSFVEKLPQSYILDGMEVDMSLCAILLRVADAMDLKHNRAPYLLYQFLINRSVSPDHWKKHMLISNCQVNERGVYRVDGICHDEAVHRCLYNHLDSVESEIEKVFKWKNGTHPRLRLSSHLVHRNVETDGYKMWHHSFEMDVLKITNLFMGEQLYGDRKLGLREIIQNSIDACLVREEINKSLDIKQDYAYEPEIYIIFDWENNQIILRDNGTGMNDYIIENFFLNIGASYYSSKDFKEKNLNYSPLGFFGIGFLATFMLSDDVYVRTSHWQEDVEYEFHFIKSDRFVTKTERQKTFSGTEIRLNLDQFIEVFDVHGTLNFTDISLIQAIGSFIDGNFWNLDIAHLQNNVM